MTTICGSFRHELMSYINTCNSASSRIVDKGQQTYHAHPLPKTPRAVSVMFFLKAVKLPKLMSMALAMS